MRVNDLAYKRKEKVDRDIELFTQKILLAKKSTKGKKFKEKFTMKKLVNKKKLKKIRKMKT